MGLFSSSSKSTVVNQSETKIYDSRKFFGDASASASGAIAISGEGNEATSYFAPVNIQQGDKALKADSFLKDIVSDGNPKIFDKETVMILAAIIGGVFIFKSL